MIFKGGSPNLLDALGKIPRASGKDKQIPKFKSYEEMGEFWDTHSLADYWDQTEQANFEISSQLRNRCLVPVDREILNRAQQIARTRGVSTESLVDLLFEQRLREIEINVSISQKGSISQNWEKTKRSRTHGTEML